MNLKKTKEVEKLQFVERMRYKKHIRIINKAGGFITRLSAFFYASRGYFKGASKRHTIYAKCWLIHLQQVEKKSYSSIHSIRGVLRPAFQLAVDDD